MKRTYSPQQTLDDLNEPNAKKQKITRSDIITLNVGGMKYQTTLSTLRNNPNSVLMKMFEGTFNTQPCDDGTYFIDRDGQHFRYILNYLRDNTLNISPNNEIIPELLAEAKYYNMTGLVNILRSYHLTSKLLNIGEENELKRLTNTINWNKIHEYEHSKYKEEASYTELYLKCNKVNPLLIISNLKQMRNKIYGVYLNKFMKNSFVFQLNKNPNTVSKIVCYPITVLSQCNAYMVFAVQPHFIDFDISEKQKIHDIEIIERDYDRNGIVMNFTTWDRDDDGNGDVSEVTEHVMFSCECYQV